MSNLPVPYEEPCYRLVKSEGKISQVVTGKEVKARIDAVIVKAKALTVIKSESDEKVFGETLVELDHQFNHCERARKALGDPFRRVVDLINGASKVHKDLIKEEADRIRGELERVKGERRRRELAEAEALRKESERKQMEAARLFKKKPSEAVELLAQAQKIDEVAAAAVTKVRGEVLRMGWKVEFAAKVDPSAPEPWLLVYQTNPAFLNPPTLNVSEVQKFIRCAEAAHSKISEDMLPGIKITPDTTLVRKNDF